LAMLSGVSLSPIVSAETHSGRCRSDLSVKIPRITNQFNKISFHCVRA
jgi:hypothetical protein